MDADDGVPRPLRTVEDEYSTTSSPTVEDFLADWLRGKRSLRPSTYAFHEAHVRRHLLPYLGNLPLGGLRAHHIERMYRLLGDKGSQGRGPRSESGLRRIHTTLAGALNTAVKRGLLDHNPASTVQLPGITKQGLVARSQEPVRKIVIQPQKFTGTISVHGVQATVSFIAESWSDAITLLHNQYGYDPEWVLRTEEPAVHAS